MIERLRGAFAPPQVTKKGKNSGQPLAQRRQGPSTQKWADFTTDRRLTPYMMMGMKWMVMAIQIRLTKTFSIRHQGPSSRRILLLLLLPVSRRRKCVIANALAFVLEINGGHSQTLSLKMSSMPRGIKQVSSLVLFTVLLCRTSPVVNTPSVHSC